MFTSIQDFENNNWIILELTRNNSDFFRDLIQNTTTQFLPEFISKNIDNYQTVKYIV